MQLVVGDCGVGMVGWGGVGLVECDDGLIWIGGVDWWVGRSSLAMGRVT